MKQRARRSGLLTRCALALGVGILQAAAFPNIGIDWLAWLAPGLLMALWLGQTGSSAFRIGYCAGLGHYFVSLYWLLLIPLPAKAVAAWIAVSAVLALYTASWSWLCWRTFPRVQARAKPDDTVRIERRVRARGLQVRSAAPVGRVPSPGVPESEVSAFKTLLATNCRQRTAWGLICACSWVAIEMSIARILTGFPWNLLGASQYRRLALIQIASVTGVYGVSFLIVWLSVSLAVAMIRAWRLRALITGVFDLALPTTALLVVVGLGLHRLSQSEPMERELKLALVQPNIPQRVIWDDREKSNRFQKLLALSQQAAATRPDMLVWPEAALPGVLTRFSLQTYEAVTNLVVPNHFWMVMGADDAESKQTQDVAGDADFFNSAFLIDPSGQLVARYHKRHLVMLGEYMPLANWFPFLNHLWSRKGSFTPGRDPTPFVLPNLGAKMSVLICFEDVFPQLVRSSVSEDTDVLVNLTNDGWFGESAAQWQHAVSALFRAVENGLPLVRCTNNGLTCWIDDRGRLHDVYFPGTQDIYGAGVKLVRIPLRTHEEKPSLPFYHRHGDWFGWTCVGIIVGLLLKKLLRPRFE
ncbi:MAG: apolipoprotein N-acyltransferase [Verrucomicrobia bacterium]|nr:MAG: apolipoprotein N-acyltransferase [Verrucomicrobiota bacterium]